MKEKKKPKFIRMPLIGELALSGIRPIIGILLGIIAGGILIAVSLQQLSFIIYLNKKLILRHLIN